MSRHFVRVSVACLALLLVATGCKSEADKYADDLIGKMKELAAVLKTVQDPDSSRAAAVKVKAIADDLTKLAQKANTIRGTQAEGERLKKRVETEMGPVNTSLAEEIRRIDSNPALQTPEFQAARLSMLPVAAMAKNAR